MILKHSGMVSYLFLCRNQYRRRLIYHSCATNTNSKRGSFGNGIRASSKKEQSSSGSGPVKQNAKPQRYHPFEEISDSESNENGEARLTAAETTRTVIEVTHKIPFIPSPNPACLCIFSQFELVQSLSLS